MSTFDPAAFICVNEEARSSLYVSQSSNGTRYLAQGFGAADMGRMLPIGPLTSEQTAAVMVELVAQGKLLVSPPREPAPEKRAKRKPTRRRAR